MKQYRKLPLVSPGLTTSLGVIGGFVNGGGGGGGLGLHTLYNQTKKNISRNKLHSSGD